MWLHCSNKPLGNTGQWGRWIERKLTHQAAPWNRASGISRASMPTSLRLGCISRGFQVSLGSGRRKATAICMTKPQHGLPTISDSLPLQHIPFCAISTPQLKKLLEAQVPISSAWLLPQPEVWRNKVSAFGSGFIKKPRGNTDGKTGQWVSWVSTCRSFIIWFQVLWDTKTQNLFELGTECDPIFHFTKKRHQSLIWGHMHWKLELQGPHPWPVLLLPHYHAALKCETWNPSVFETPHLLQYSIRIENKDS